MSEQEQRQELDQEQFLKLQAELTYIPRVNLNLFHIDNTDLYKIKGRYAGMIFTDQNVIWKRVKGTIKDCGFQIEESFFLEEEDEKFTNISFIIKPKQWVQP